MTRSRLSSLVAVSPPLLVALLVARFWLSGSLRYYVNDRTVWIVLIGGALFGLVGAAGAWAALRGRGEARLTWRTLAFLTPVVLGLVAPSGPLTATTGQASSLGALQVVSHVSSGPPGDSFGAWVGDLSAHPDPSWWAGQRVTLVGFVSRQVGLPPRSFIVARFLVTCCVVDATLLGFPVQLDRNPVPPQGAWVQVSGQFGQEYWTDPSGAHYPLIQHAHISPVSIPSSQYLSP